MATSKAPYKGDDTGFRIRDRAKALKHELTAYYVDNVKLTAKIDENPLEVAEEFGACIAAQAQNALADFDLLKFESTKQEIRAEQVDLLRDLKCVHRKLRRLSPGFDRILSVDADPLGCADKIQELIAHVEAVRPVIDALPSPRLIERQHDLVVEFAVGILPILEDFEISVAATGDPAFDNWSHAVKILKIVGDAFGFVRAPATWRDIIIEAKRQMDP